MLMYPRGLIASVVPLADACVTEWRYDDFGKLTLKNMCHSLMLVLLNGGLLTVVSFHFLSGATR